MAQIMLDQVDKIYAGGAKAVDGLNLHIRDGEFMVLVGPSGCGKTTALRMIAGLEEIDAGAIRIGAGRGQRPAAEGPRHRDGVPELRAVPAYDGRGEHRLRAEDAQACPRTEIEPAGRARRPSCSASSDYLDRKPAALSGGQRQRVAMGRAIVREPQAFLMDEPLSNLDAKLRVQMRAAAGPLQRGWRRRRSTSPTTRSRR